MTLPVYQSEFTGAEMDEADDAVLNKALGFLYVSGNENPTDIVETQTYYPVVADSQTVTGINSLFTAVNGRLTYTGTASIKARLTLTACLSMDDSNKQIRMRIGINGVALDSSCAQDSITGNPQSGRRESFGTHTFAVLNEGDYVEGFVADWTNTTDILVRNMQLSAEQA
jgi:hypothetical protein